MKYDKFYLYYLKCANNNIYAWTCSKDYAKQFESTRYMSAFIKRVIKFDDELTCSLFMNRYSNMKLVEIPVTDGKNDFMIVGTSHEEFHLEEAYQSIVDDIKMLEINFSENFPLKPKYQQAIDELLDFVAEVDGKITFMLDTFALFYYIHRGTFTNDPEWKILLNNGESFLNQNEKGNQTDEIF